MRKYKVLCFDDGIWDEEEPRAVEAEGESQAAELVCGETNLLTSGKYGQLRAEVWLEIRPEQKHHFFRRPGFSN